MKRKVLVVTLLLAVSLTACSRENVIKEKIERESNVSGTSLSLISDIAKLELSGYSVEDIGIDTILGWRGAISEINGEVVQDVLDLAKPYAKCNPVTEDDRAVHPDNFYPDDCISERVYLEINPVIKLGDNLIPMDGTFQEYLESMQDKTLSVVARMLGSDIPVDAAVRENFKLDDITSDADYIQVQVEDSNDDYRMFYSKDAKTGEYVFWYITIDSPNVTLEGVSEMTPRGVMETFGKTYMPDDRWVYYNISPDDSFLGIRWSAEEPYQVRRLVFEKYREGFDRNTK